MRIKHLGFDLDCASFFGSSACNKSPHGKATDVVHSSIAVAFVRRISALLIFGFCFFYSTNEYFDRVLRLEAVETRRNEFHRLEYIVSIITHRRGQTKMELGKLRYV